MRKNGGRSVPPPRAFERVLRTVRRRWVFTTVAEAAGGAAAAAGVVAATLLFLLPGVAWPAAAVAAAIVFARKVGRLPTPADAADRLDRQFAAQELFGTVARLRDANGGGAGLLRRAADVAAAGLPIGELRVRRIGPAGWAARAAAILLPTLPLLLLPTGRGGERDTAVASAGETSFVKPGEVLGRDTPAREPAAPARGEINGTPASSTPTRTSRATPAEAGRPAPPRASPSSGSASSPGASAGRDSSPDVQLPKDNPAAEPSATGRPEIGGGGASSSPTAGTAAAASGTSSNDRPAAAPATPADAAPPDPGDDDATRQVPPAYRDLVRRYFLGRPPG